MSYRAGVSDGRFDAQRHVFGFVMASLAAALIAVLVLAFGVFTPDEGPVGSLIVAALMFPSTVAMVGAVAGLVGGPAILVFAGLKIESVWSYALAGFVIGAFLAFLLSSERDYYPDTLIFFSTFGGAPGLVWGVIWWITARRAQDA